MQKRRHPYQVENKEESMSETPLCRQGEFKKLMLWGDSNIAPRRAVLSDFVTSDGIRMCAMACGGYGILITMKNVSMCSMRLTVQESLRGGWLKTVLEREVDNRYGDRSFNQIINRIGKQGRFWK